MKKRKLFLGVLLASALIGMAACDGPDKTDDDINDGSGDNQQQAEQFTVSFNTNGGSTVTSQTVTKDGKATQPGAPTKAATAQYTYTFAGWYKDVALTQAFDFNTGITADTVLYAKWNQTVNTYTVTFNSNGGSAVQQVSVNYGGKVTKPTDPSKAAEGETRYAFGGWYKEAALTNAFDFANDTITGATTLYAKWDVTNKFSVIFESNGGTAVDTQLVYDGDFATEPETTPTKEADAQYTYEFGGWYADAQFNTPFAFATTAITDDTTIYAKWNTTVNKYTVTFMDGEDEFDTVEDVEYGTAPTAPTTPRKEADAQYTYTFVGWSKNADGTEVFDFDTDTIVGDTTLYAKWDKVVNKYTVTFDSNGGTDVDPMPEVEYGTKIEAPAKPYGLPEEGYVTVFAGWYTDTDLKKEFYFGTPIVGDTTLYAKWVKVAEADAEGYTLIASISDLNEFRYATGKSGKFKLVDDIDLEGVTLEGTQNYFTGTFDGDGHVIRNASYVENAANKTGILVRELNDGGIIKNVKFVNCTAQYNGETIGLVSGMVTGSVQFLGLEFNACSVGANNYAGMLTGRINATGTTLIADEITTKNGCRSSLTSYGGFLIGDIAGGASPTAQNVVTFTNMDISGEIKGGNLNGSFIFGRIRNNTICTLENSVIRSAKLSAADMGLLAGGGTTNGKNVNVNISNVAILSTAGVAKLQSLGDLMEAKSLGEGEFLTTYDLQNVYIPQGSTLSLGTTVPQTPIHNDVTALSAEVTPTWLQSDLNLDFTTKWMVEEQDNTKYRLRNSSTNVKNADATLVSIKATTSNAQTRFTAGSEFNSEGLVIAAIYSDDVQLILDPADYEVISTAFNNAKAGTYTITVKANEKNAAGEDVTTTYDVILAEQTGFKLDTQFTKLVYTTGEALDLSNLLVYSLWTDGVETKEVNSKDEYDKYTVDFTAFNNAVAGSYDIVIGMTGFDTQTIAVSVIGTKPVVVDGNIYINVDAAASIDFEGEKVDGVETFTTVTSAINYLASAKLGDINKVIYIADGFYHEKITVPSSLTNLKIIGESMEGTIIDYDAVEGTINPLNGTVYKMDCATLHVNATGFGLENITVQNSFNYIEDASKYGDPQGFALTIAADGAVLNNVHLFGNQDTLFFKKGRVYIVDSKIEGNVDFIFGENDGLAFFDHCTINAVYRGDTNNTGYVTAMKGDTGSTKPAYGYIFNNCVFTADENVRDGSMSLGRPWGGGATVAMINCNFSAAYSTLSYTTDDKTKSRWFSMSGNSPINADYCEYGSTGDGKITEAVVGGRILTEEQAANYTAANLFAATNGGINWSSGAFDYAGALTKLQAMLNKVDPTEIVVLDGSDAVGDTYEVANEDSAALTIIPKEWNANTKGYTVTFGDDTIAKFENGKVYGLALGTTTMTIAIGNVTRTINLTVATAESFTVTFDVPTGVTAPAAQTVFKNKKVTKPAALSLEGSVFKGWFKDAEFTEEFDFDTDLITADTTIYAKFLAWEDMYTENIIVYFDGTEGDGVDSFTFVGVNGANANANHAPSCGIVHTAKLLARSANGDTQFNNNVEASFKVEKYATITIHQKEAFTMECYFNGVLVTPTIIQPVAPDKVVTYIYETTEAGTFMFKNTAGGNKYLTSYLSVTYPKIIEESTNITFGSEGNYKTIEGLNYTSITRDNGGNNSQLGNTDGELSFYVKAGTVIAISSYSGYTNYTLTADGQTSEAQTGTAFTYEVQNDGKVVIKSTTSNNYFYSLSIIAPTVIEKSTTISFGTEGNYKTIDGLIYTAISRDNGTNNCQLGNTAGELSFRVKAGAKIIVSSYSGYTAYTLTADGQTSEEQTGTAFEYVAQTDGKVVIKSTSSNNYLYSVTISYPKVLDVDTTITFGSAGNYKSVDGLVYTSVSRDNGEDNCQLGNTGGEISFSVKAGATITIASYSGYTAYTLTADDQTSAEQTGTSYTYVAQNDGKVVIKSTSSNNYFYSITITY